MPPVVVTGQSPTVVVSNVVGLAKTPLKTEGGGEERAE